ncbi:ribosome recycling factor [Candidatus Saccharibacteria bacterium]|nr:ribosome recycling factor [Candidatus Saccharibacteria bacterium]MCB9821328.1 ribosome recycling factor [Candidatus Nomurabacteria bacterium]
MDGQQYVVSASKKFNESVEHFEAEASKVRTGRAHPSMLDGIMVEAYGTEMPLIQCGSISVPENTLLQITPFDPNNIQAISAAIRNDQQLGLNPSDDGRVVRVPVPPLTSERRQQLVKVLNEKKEDAFISMRTSRHDALKEIKDNVPSQDEAKRLETQVDEAMNKAKNQIETVAKTKEQEILTV